MSCKLDLGNVLSAGKGWQKSQHQASSFKLVDPTKPEYRRSIALWLVDPTLRIISTANVPP
jgi:hypothetical protein